MFVVVSISGKQYKVTPGQIVEVNKIDGKAGDTVTFAEVLLTEENGKTQVGTPTVSGVTVTAKIIDQGKGEKVDVMRFKSKVRERKHIGFRPQITKLQIVSIGK